jgi:hypothetical protein
MHLNADELVDLAEGARPESSAPHLAACPQCRAQLDDLRAMMSAVAAVDVPEPSPLFWDHFSQRVHDAVASENARGDARLEDSRSFWERAAGILHARALQASVVAIAALIIFVVSNSRVMAPHAPALSPGTGAGVGQPAPLAARDLLSDSAIEGDPSLTLVASLTSTLDADATRETGLAKVGSAEHAVTHMNDAELRELQRLLQEEMAP